MESLQMIIKQYQLHLITKNLKPKQYIVEINKIINEVQKMEKISYNKCKFIKTLIKFLIEAFSGFLDEKSGVFPHILTLLNSIIKSNSKLRITASKRFIFSLHFQFVSYQKVSSSLFVFQNVLWLVLKTIKGAHNKNIAFQNIMSSGIIWIFLNKTDFNQVTENGIRLLLVMMLNSKASAIDLIMFLRNKFQNDKGEKTSLGLIMSTIAETQFNPEIFNEFLLPNLRFCLQHYLNRDQINIKERISNYNVIYIKIYSLSQEINSLALLSILKDIVQAFDLKYLKITQKIYKIIEKLSGNAFIMKKILKFSVECLHKNPIARTLFVHYYNLLNNVDLINIMSSELPKEVEKLLNNDQEVHSCLKIVICLKICVKKNGLQQIFAYTFKEVLQKIFKNKEAILNIPNVLQVWQLLQQVFKQNLEKQKLF